MYDRAPKAKIEYPNPQPSAPGAKNGASQKSSAPFKATLQSGCTVFLLDAAIFLDAASSVSIN